MRKRRESAANSARPPYGVTSERLSTSMSVFGWAHHVTPVGSGPSTKLYKFGREAKPRKAKRRTTKS